MAANFVKEWMTPNPKTIGSSATLPEAYWVMIKNDIRRLPVVDHGKLVGIITLEDLRRFEPISMAGMDLIRMSDMLSTLPVRRVMNTDLKTISPERPLIDAAKMLLENKISALPVVDNEELVGIITESDIFRAFVEMEISS